jgi:hypothetical protein
MKLSTGLSGEMAQFPCKLEVLLARLFDEQYNKYPRMLFYSI